MLVDNKVYSRLNGTCKRRKEEGKAEGGEGGERRGKEEGRAEGGEGRERRGEREGREERRGKVQDEQPCEASNFQTSHPSQPVVCQHGSEGLPKIAHEELLSTLLPRYVANNIASRTMHIPTPPTCSGNPQDDETT